MKFNLEKKIKLENLLMQEKNIFYKMNQVFKNDNDEENMEQNHDENDTNIKSIKNILSNDDTVGDIETKKNSNMDKSKDKNNKLLKRKGKKKTQKKKRGGNRKRKYLDSNKKYSKKNTRHKIKKERQNNTYNKKEQDDEKLLIETLKQKLKSLKLKVSLIQNNQKL